MLQVLWPAAPLLLAGNMSTAYDVAVILLGDSAIGKTTLLNRIMSEGYCESAGHTIGCDVGIKRMVLCGQAVTLKVVDAAGTMRLHYVTMSMLGAFAAEAERTKKPIAVIVGVDTTRRDSAYALFQRWLSFDAKGACCNTFLAGYKADELSREVSHQELLALADAHPKLARDRVFEVDPKTGRGVRELLEVILRDRSPHASSSSIVCGRHGRYVANPATEYLLICEAGIGRFVVDRYRLEQEARRAAKALWCCWVLFARDLPATPILHELAAGGIGLSAPSIRTYAETFVQEAARAEVDVSETTKEDGAEKARTWKESAGRKEGRDGYVFGDISRGVAARLFKGTPPIEAEEDAQPVGISSIAGDHAVDARPNVGISFVAANEAAVRVTLNVTAKRPPDIVATAAADFRETPAPSPGGLSRENRVGETVARLAVGVAGGAMGGALGAVGGPGGAIVGAAIGATLFAGDEHD